MLKIAYYTMQGAFALALFALVVMALEYIAHHYQLPALAWLALWGAGIAAWYTVWTVWEALTWPMLDAILRQEG